jgi:hypothetical protein
VKKQKFAHADVHRDMAFFKEKKTMELWNRTFSHRSAARSILAAGTAGPVGASLAKSSSQAAALKALNSAGISN